MRLGRRQLRTARGISFNATPMIDVIFTLTIFFMLVTRFSSAEQKPMQLPKPDQSQAKSASLPDRVIINCQLIELGGTAGVDVHYSLGPNNPEPLDMLADRLIAMKNEVPDLKVVIRADRRLPYDDVRAVMRVVAQAGVEMLNVVAHVAEDEAHAD